MSSTAHPRKTQKRGQFPSRLSLLLVLLAAAAVAISACGSGSEAGATNEQGAGSDESAAGDPALAFAQCMRDHGFDVEDPGGSSGNVLVGGGLDVEDPEQAAAIEECRESSGLAEQGIGPGGMRAGDGDTQLADMDALVDFVDCMRDEGIDMPDPTPEGGIVPPDDLSMGAGRGGPFQDAMDTCREHLAGGGVAIMRGDG